MSINDPQWGNSHRPEQKDPDQVPELTGTDPVQPEGGQSDASSQKDAKLTPKTPPPEGPPDLEALWQQLVYKIRCRVARLFGWALPISPETPASPPAYMPTMASTDAAPVVNWQALSFKSGLIGAMLIVGAWLVSGFYLVDTPQRGVLSRFGRVVAVEDPGWHWRWPYPIDSVRLINMNADRTLEVGFTAQKGKRQSEGLMLTADGNLVAIAYAVVYQVTDPVAYLSRADDPADLLALLAASSVRDAVAVQTLTAVQAVNNQTTAVTAGWLKTAREHLQAAVSPLALGVSVKRLEIKAVQLPPPVLQAAKDAEREEVVRAKALRDAQVVSTDNLIKARKLASKLQDESEAYAKALDNESLMIRVAADKTEKVDPEQAAQSLGKKMAQWRQQYPLVFASPTSLQTRVQTSSQTDRTMPVGASPSEEASVAAPLSGDWRDREIMRSRDRVDRPGSGS